METLTGTENRKHLGFARAALGTAIISYIAIVLGGIVRATGAAGACAGWPVCGGGWLPAFEAAVLADYGHKLAAFGLGPALIVLLIVAVRTRLFRSFTAALLLTSLALVTLQGLQGAAVAGTEVAARPAL